MPDPFVKNPPEVQFDPDKQAPIDAGGGSFMQSFGASFEAVQRTRGLNAEWQNQRDYIQDRLDEYQRKTGEHLSNPWNGSLEFEGPVGDVEQKNKDKFDKAGMAWPSDDEIVQGGVLKARGAVKRDALLAQSPGLTPWLGRQAAGVASAAIDPINAAALALAPEGGLLIRAAGVGAAFAGATEAENALTFNYQKQVNPNLTEGQAFVREPLEAGLAGAGLEAGGSLLARWWRSVRGTGAEIQAPLAVQDAGKIAEKASDLMAQKPDGMDSLVHAASVKETEAAILAGRRPDLPPEPEVNIADTFRTARDDVAKAQEAGRPIQDVQNEAFRSDLTQAASRMYLKDDGSPATEKQIETNLQSYQDGIKPPAAAEVTPPARPHRDDLIEQATRPEMLAQPHPQEPESVQAELGRMREEGRNLVFDTNAKGEIQPTVIDHQMAQNDSLRAAANEVRNCLMPAQEAAE